ncbi:MAG: SMP-30/gluconolactonase/LRE family protein, partial [Nocardioidaceae bacterium]
MPTWGCRPGLMPDVERVVPPVAELAESPVWDPATSSLLWVDIPAGTVYRYRPESGNETVLVAGEPVGAVGVRVGGGLVLAVGLGVELVDPDGSRRALAKVEAGDRMNDAKCDPFGRFVAGTLRADETPGGAGLYAIESDGTVRLLRSDVTLSNGLGWTADGRTMFHIDTT